MAATLHSPLPSNPSTPPTPSSAFPAALARLRETALERNASTSSSRSTQTNDSSISTTSSLEAVPMRPPPDKTRTAATPISQLPSRPSSAAGPSTASAQYAGQGDGGFGSRGQTAPAGPSAYAYGSQSDYHSPSAVYGGRNFQRNGPRMGGGRHATSMLPSIITSDAPMRSSSVPLPEHPGQRYGGKGPPQMGLQLSPTTPRQSRFFDNTDADSASMGASLRPRPPSSAMGSPNLRGSVPSSPIEMRQRGLSAGQEKSRERRQSSNSARSTGSARPRETPADYLFGEELGRGSYSTVVQAVRAIPLTQSPTSPRPPRQYAIKIINQAHLVAEKKTKYAMIERDALVRLNAPISGTGVVSPQHAKGHRRGMSGSSNGGGGNIASGPRKNRSSVSLNTNQTQHQSQYQYPTQSQGSSRRDSTVDRLSINTSLSDSTSSAGGSASVGLGSSAPLSPTLQSMPSSLAGRRPSRSADPPEMVPERSEDGHSEVLARSRPPSPVREDSRENVLDGAPLVVTPPRRSQLQDGSGASNTSRAGGLGYDAAYGPPDTPMPVNDRNGGDGLDAPQTPKLTSESMQVESAYADRKTQSATAAEKRVARRSNEDGEPVPRSRRASKARSDRSSRSVGARSHPGVIRLFSTFNDATSLYFVLDLAANGELLGQLRKYGSLDTESARYYAAQLLDVVEFMHERGVVHRDLKPENILLDDDMRIKVTDFGSAKLLDADAGPEEGKKRSFVGSADFVSPEVLRNEPASAASDVWAFGCIVYQLFIGKPPFRGATDYLTFQKILKRDMEYPEGFPVEAKALIDAILDLDTTSRPTASDLKRHAFFAPIDWTTIWTTPAPHLTTGLTKPVVTLANIDPQSDMWAVFDDDMSDGGFGDDADLENSGLPHDPATVAPHAQMRQQPTGHPDHAHIRQISSEDPHRWSPQYDRLAAEDAVRSVDLTDPADAHRGPGHEGVDGEGGDDDLDPPRPGWMDSVRKKRGFSRGSARTSSSSSANRTALTGLLESMGIHSIGQPGSGRTSRNSMKSEDPRPAVSAAPSPQKGKKKSSRSGSGTYPAGAGERMKLQLPQTQGGEGSEGSISNLLLANERVIFTSAVSIRTSALPSFLTPNATKHRQLVLTDFPRLFAVKDESGSGVTSHRDKDSATSGNVASADAGIPGVGGSGSRRSSMVIKNECVLVSRASAASAISMSSAGAVQPVDLRAGIAPGSPAASAAAIGPDGVNRLIDVQEKGPKGFLVNTSQQTVTYYADTTDLRNEWLRVIRQAAE